MARYILISLLTIFTIATFDANGADISLKKRKKGCVTHVVNYGEDVTTILKRYEITLTDLEMFNSQLKNNISPGTIIFIPRNRIGKSTQEQIKKEINKIRGIESVDDNTTTDSQARKNEDLIATTECFQHLTKKDETLTEISKLYSIPVEDIQLFNKDIKGNMVSSGYIVNIPTSPINRDQTTEASTEVDSDESAINTPAKELKPTFEFKTDDKTLRVSLMLPLKEENSLPSKNFVQFYQGFLIGLDSLKNEGLSVEMNVINVDKNSSKESIDSLMQLNSVSNSNIVVGPIYSEQFDVVAKSLSEKNIPIISPLAAIESGVRNAFQVAPIESTKYNKLQLKVAGKNVILLRSSSDDKEFVDKIKEFTDGTLVEVDFNVKKKPEDYVEEQLSKDKENIYVIAATDPMQADAIISKVGMIKMFAIGKSVSSIATSRLARMSGINPSNLFSADVSYVTSYHADMTNRKVKRFNRDYMLHFGSEPSLYSYRGYDVALFFLGSLKEFESEFYQTIEDYYTTILQVTYRFVRDENDGKFINDEWMCVSYTPSYDIVVE